MSESGQTLETYVPRHMRHREYKATATRFPFSWWTVSVTHWTTWQRGVLEEVFYYTSLFVCCFKFFDMVEFAASRTHRSLPLSHQESSASSSLHRAPSLNRSSASFSPTTKHWGKGPLDCFAIWHSTEGLPYGDCSQFFSNERELAIKLGTI
jgi:hypothetical protein